MGGVNLYACDFFLITTQPKCRLKKAEFVFSQARVMMEGKGGKRVEIIGKKGLK